MNDTYRSPHRRGRACLTGGIPWPSCAGGTAASMARVTAGGVRASLRSPSLPMSSWVARLHPPPWPSRSAPSGATLLALAGRWDGGGARPTLRASQRLRPHLDGCRGGGFPAADFGPPPVNRVPW